MPNSYNNQDRVSSATHCEVDSPITLPRNSLSFLAHAPLTCSSGICDWVSMCTAPELHGEASVVSQNLISCWLRLTLLTRPHEKICKRVLAHISADLHFLTATRAALSLVSCVVHLLASSHQFRDLASSTCDHSIDHAHCPASPWKTPAIQNIFRPASVTQRMPAVVSPSCLRMSVTTCWAFRGTEISSPSLRRL